MATQQPRTDRPTGRDEIRDALLDSAARHFAAHGTNASLRDIAADANVNLGLIHRHFGNKDVLLRAVIERQIEGGVEFIARAPDSAAAIRQIFESGVGTYARTVAWLLLENEGSDELYQDHFPAIEALRARAASEDAELRLLAAFTIIYGWAVFGRQLLAAFGHSPEARPDVEAQIADLIEQLVAREPRTASG